MLLRPYDPTDLAAVAGLFTSAVHALTGAHYDAAQREAWAPRPPDLAAWRTRLEPLDVLVAQDDEGLAGFVATAPAGRLELLFVAPHRARRGVATRLYVAAEAALAVQGARTITTEASDAARPFFERQGFLPVEDQTVTRAGVHLHRTAMRKDL